MYNQGGPTGAHAKVYMTKGVLHQNNMGIEKAMLGRVFEIQNWLQAQMLCNNDRRSARNLMVIARMPED
eukprot:3986905-Heterocapsa_arctica.AAC.1